MEKIIIYTDGSSKGNPGPGGWAAVILSSKSEALNSKSEIKEIGGREDQTTNNRMELTAAIEALKKVKKDSEVEIFTDSEYLMKGITMWIWNWIKHDWKTKDMMGEYTREILNRDLWEKLFEETQKRKVEWKKVAGHSGHKFNDRCDLIATSFADDLNISLYNGSRSRYKFIS